MKEHKFTKIKSSVPAYSLLGNWEQTGSGIPNQQYIPYQTASYGSVIPKVDVIDTGDNIIYVFDLPGTDPNNIELEIDHNKLFISGPIESFNNASYIYQERHKGKYNRTLNAPVNVDTEQVKADFKNGILEVSFSKTKEKSAPTSSI